MQYIWMCMKTAYEVVFGIFFWISIFTVMGIIITGLTYLFSSEWRNNHRKDNSKPKYEGKPILVNGGKDET